MLTVPVGHNPGVTDYLQSPHPEVVNVRAMRRTTAINLRHEVPVSAVSSVQYGKPYSCANAILVMEARIP